MATISCANTGGTVNETVPFVFWTAGVALLTESETPRDNSRGSSRNSTCPIPTSPVDRYLRAG